MVFRNRPKVSAHEQRGAREIILIPEICNMTGMTDEMRSNYRIMLDVGNITRLTPKQRQQSLMKFIDRVEKTPEAKKILSDWGLVMNKDAVSVKGI